MTSDDTGDSGHAAADSGDAAADSAAVFFADAAEFRAWLEAHHDSEPELWMVLRRKGVSPQGLTWAQAVPEALCFGWIDSTSRRIDDTTRRQRWSPRKPGSIWSDVNVAHVERLRAEGRMHPAGLAAFEQRSPARTGVYSHENAQTLTAAEEAAVESDAAAAAFWTAATPGYRRTAGHWVASAKRAETRADRLRTLVDDCRAGRLIPPQRYGTPPAWVVRARAAAEAGGPVE